jgi:hypothetical protein
MDWAKNRFPDLSAPGKLWVMIVQRVGDNVHSAPSSIPIVWNKQPRDL